MERRRFLAVTATAGAAALAGCTAGYQGRVGDDTAAGGSGTGSDPEFRRAAPRDGIPAITDPTFADDWSEVEIEMPDSNPRGSSVYRPRLARDDEVIGVEVDGRARAYPLSVLSWHEVVNDRFGGPLLVTYCPICRSGMVAERRVEGEATRFGVSGLLHEENLVLYDARTESLWSQIEARAIDGPMTGTRLSLRPSTLTTWSAWQDSHPDTEVLLPPPLSDTVLGRLKINYDFDLYAQWSALDDEFGSNDYSDTRLPRKALVLGIVDGEEAVAYPYLELQYDRVVTDTVGDLPVVAVLAPDETLRAYDRRIDGRTLRFRADEREMVGGGSRWDPATGEALDGPFEGQRLDAVPGTTTMYWFAWLRFHPDTTVWGRD